MNDEKTIAKTIMDAKKMHHDSYSEDSERCTMSYNDCLLNAARDNELSENLWYLFTLIEYRLADTWQWAEKILADENWCSCPTGDNKDDYIDELCPVHKTQ